MREVAAAARVSIKTVSRVVNGERGVTPRLSERVAAAVERVGYRHNLNASSLRRTGRSRGRLLYRTDTATITLKRGRSGVWAVRAVAHAVPLDGNPMPVVSASLELGASEFATSLSCPPRGGRRFSCRG